MNRFWRFLGIAVVLTATAMVTKPARAAQDVVQFGNSIEVGKDTTVHDTVCFFCSVNVKGTVTGDTVVFFGSVNMEGHAERDVVVFFGGVKAANETSIGQNLVNFFGTVQLGENASVGRDLVVMFGNLRAADSSSIGGDRVVQPGWVFWTPFLLLFGGIYFLVHEVRGMRRRRILRGY